MHAQTYVKPAMKVTETSFAVITDKGTYQACETELKAYQETLGQEGLPTFIVYNDWKKPEDVKKVAPHVLAHRIVSGSALSSEDSVKYIEKIIAGIPVPQES